MPKKAALISDIHANADAFAAVRDDIAQQHVDAVWMLGDISGRGPDPVLTTRQAKRLYDAQLPDAQGCWLAGNHDYLVLGKLSRSIFMKDDTLDADDQVVGTESGLNGSAVEVAEMHAKRLEGIPEIRKWLNNLPTHCHPQPNLYLAHGLYMLENGKVNERFALGMYGTPANLRRMFRNLREHAPVDEQPAVVLLGHTHEAGIWRWQAETETIEALGIPEQPMTLDGLTVAPVVINPGSVGFSRNVLRPTYALLSFEDICSALTVEFRTVPYT